MFIGLNHIGVISSIKDAILKLICRKKNQSKHQKKQKKMVKVQRISAVVEDEGFSVVLIIRVDHFFHIAQICGKIQWDLDLSADRMTPIRFVIFFYYLGLNYMSQSTFISNYTILPIMCESHKLLYALFCEIIM